MIKRILSAVLAFVCVALVLPSAVIAAEFSPVRTYDGRFSDISENDWYYAEVTDAYSLGLIDGASDTLFEPNGVLTVAEAVKLAAVCHQLLTKGEVAKAESDPVWYRPYLEYCKSNYIVTEDYADYDARALRCQIAVLFSRAITASGTESEDINEITPDVLGDVESSDWYSGAVYRMYRWGIMTGDENGNMNPNDTVKRCEIAAVIMRVIDPSVRIRVGEEPEVEPEETAPLDKIVLYGGSDSSASFAGITGFAANFKKNSGAWSAERSYSLNLIDDLVLEPDNISFKLYKGSGYEALGIVRGWLNATARGQDGEEVRDADAVREKLNELIYIWINGRQVKAEEMWYAEHGDYVTYAFYFGKTANLQKVETVDIMCGRLGSDIMATDALSAIKALLNGEDGEDGDAPSDPPADSDSDIYRITVDDIKSSAKDILFEYECSRCTVIYGKGMYGGDEGEYRLLFVFRDGSTQTVYAQKLEEIRMNADGDVLYYTVTAPDGEPIQYGVNFKE